MKKWIVPLLAAALLAGCQSTPQETEVPQEPIQPPIEEEQPNIEAEPEVMSEDDIIQQFDLLLEEEALPGELMAYVEDEVLHVSLDSANRMVLTIFDQLAEYSSDRTDTMLSERLQEQCDIHFEQGFSSANFNDIEDPLLMELVEEVRENGAEIIKMEPYYVVVPNLDELIRRFGNEIGEGTLTYIRLMGEELLEPYQIDTLEARNAYAARIIDFERFVRNYPNFTRIQEIMSRVQVMTRRYLLGDTLGDTYDLQTLELYPYVQTSYRDIITHYAGSELASRISAMQTELERMGNYLTTNTTFFIDAYDTLFKDRTMRLNRITEHDVSRVSIVSPEFVNMANEHAQQRMNETIDRTVQQLKDTYWPMDIEGARFTIDYSLHTSALDQITIVFYSNLMYPKTPQLSVGDQTAITFDLNTGGRLRLDDQFRADARVYLDVLDRAVMRQLNKRNLTVDNYTPLQKDAPYLIEGDELVLIFRAGTLGKNAVRFEVPLDDLSTYLK